MGKTLILCLLFLSDKYPTNIHSWSSSWRTCGVDNQIEMGSEIQPGGDIIWRRKSASGYFWRARGVYVRTQIWTENTYCTMVSLLLLFCFGYNWLFTLRQFFVKHHCRMRIWLTYASFILLDYTQGWGDSRCTFMWVIVPIPTGLSTDRQVRVYYVTTHYLTIVPSEYFSVSCFQVCRLWLRGTSSHLCRDKKSERSWRARHTRRYCFRLWYVQILVSF